MPEKKWTGNCLFISLTHHFACQLMECGPNNVWGEQKGL